MASSKSSLQDQYFEILRSGQEAMSNAMDEWSKSAKDAWGRPDASVPTFATLDPVEAVDQAFAFAGEALQAQRRLLDFSAEILETQRQFAKNITANSAATATAATAEK